MCAAKNDEVVEYAMSRIMSPLLVSQYQLQLPDKAVLEKKFKRQWLYREGWFKKDRVLESIVGR